MISPNESGAKRVTINPDVTYTTVEILTKSDKETIEAWANEMAEYSPQLIIRFESAPSTEHNSTLRYYKDLLSAMNKHGFSWYSNDYWPMLNPIYFFAGVTPVKYYGINMDVEMLKLYQQYR